MTSLFLLLRPLLTSGRFWAVVILAGLFGTLALRAAHYKSVAEDARDDLRQEQLQNKALSDSLRLMVDGDSTDTYAKRTHFDEDSLRRVVEEETTREVREAMLSERREVIAALKLEWQAEVAEAFGSVQAHMTLPDTLRFTIDDEVGAFHLWADLTVQGRSLDYHARITPDPTQFNLYTVRTEDGGLELWADASGRVTRLDSYALPSATAPPKERTSSEVSASLGAGFDVIGGEVVPTLSAGLTYAPWPAVSLSGGLNYEPMSRLVYPSAGISLQIAL